jgi:tetratricopeptide (TPR) repeat protein
LTTVDRARALRDVRSSTRRVRAALAAVALTTVCRAACADAYEDAKKTFADGVELEKRGDYAAALDKFRDAARLKATAGVRFHEGYALEMLGRLASALEAYEAAESAARDQNKVDVLPAIRRRAEPLRERVPRVAIHVRSPSDAVVTIDDRPLAAGARDGAPFPIDPGEHLVFAHAKGHRDLAKRLAVDEGHVESVDIDLERLPVRETAAPPESAHEPPPKRGRSLALPLTTTAGAAAAAAGGVVAFLLAGSAQADAQAECPQRVDCEDQRDAIRGLDAIAALGFAAAAVLASVSVVLWTRPRPASGAVTWSLDALTGAL